MRADLVIVLYLSLYLTLHTEGSSIRFIIITSVHTVGGGGQRESASVRFLE